MPPEADGTINRAALLIFNPEDLNALETALRLKMLIRLYRYHSDNGTESCCRHYS